MVDLFSLKRNEWQNPDLPTLRAWLITTPLGVSSRVVAERNPFYWKIDPEGNQLPYLDNVVYDVVQNEEVMLLKALNGEIDMHVRHINTLRNKAVLFDGMEQGNYRLFDAIPSMMNNMIIALNLTHKDPVKREIFQNKDFRIGLSHAIDRQEIIDLVYIGQGEPWQAAPRPEAPFYHEELAKQYTDYNGDLANEYLDRAGYTERDAEGFRLGPDRRRISFTILVENRRFEFSDILELVQQDWAEVGIDIRIDVIDGTLFRARTLANEHDAAVDPGDNGHKDAILDPRWYFPFFDQAAFYARTWYNWYVNNELEKEEPPAATRRQMELYDQLKATVDPDAQIELMTQILDIAAEEFYIMGISLPIGGYGIVKNTFHNVPESMPEAFRYPTPGPSNPQQYFEDIE